METPKKPKVLPLRAITQEEGLMYARAASKRCKIRAYSTSLLDLVTDPIQPHSYKPDANPDDPGRRRLHPVLVSGIVCLGLMFILFLYFSYWQ